MVLGTWDDLTPDESDLRYHLVATATIMGAGFSEYDQWYTESTRKHRGWNDYDRGRIRKNFREDEEEDEWDEELEEDDFEDDGIEPHAKGGLPGLLPFRHENERAGRNDPCPCGSGKKYKKCCLKKQNGTSLFD
ncbi:MAG: SEC-C domain-containing protein [Candidatus Nealsonbacteria bacterium]|nr:SEC-C domain-containing protein [Candidatus Nealsonbacteria bacterium]